MNGTHALPERPPSEVEWEDLLVRLDIAPRAVRAAAEDAADTPELRRLIGAALAAELWWGERLDDLRDGRPLSLDPETPTAAASATVAESLEALAAARGRSFARLQRRGLDVWDWRAELAGGGAVTGYQMALLRARADGALIGAIRALPRG